MADKKKKPKREHKKISIYRVKYQVHPQRNVDWTMEIAAYDLKDIEEFLRKIYKNNVTILEFGVLAKIDAMTDEVVDNIVREVMTIKEKTRKKEIFVCQYCGDEFDSKSGRNLHEKRWCEVKKQKEKEKAKKISEGKKKAQKEKVRKKLEERRLKKIREKEGQ